MTDDTFEPQPGMPTREDKLWAQNLAFRANPPAFLHLDEAAIVLGLSEDVARRLYAAGTLPGREIAPGLVMVVRDELVQVLSGGVFLCVDCCRYLPERLCEPIQDDGVCMECAAKNRNARGAVTNGHDPGAPGAGAVAQ